MHPHSETGVVTIQIKRQQFVFEIYVGKPLSVKEFQNSHEKTSHFKCCAPPLSELTEFEQLLISPVLPLVYIYRLQGYRQYQCKGECVAFQHNVQRIASELPRSPSDIIINIADVYGKGIIQIGAYLINAI